MKQPIITLGIKIVHYFLETSDTILQMKSKKTSQHSQACISDVWGCINAQGVGSLHMRKGNINAGKACPWFTATCGPFRIIVGSLYSPHNSWSTPIRLSVI